MKKIFIMVLASLFFSVGLAQAHCGQCGVGETKDMKAKAESKLEMMTKELNLTDEQKSKIEAAMKAKMEKKEQIVADKQKAMEAVSEEFKAALKEILSADQLKMWEAAKDKCPMCKEGKMCEMCMKKAKDEGHDHEHKKE